MITDRTPRWRWRHRNRKELDSGVDAFIHAVRQCVEDARLQQQTTPDFIFRISEDFAFIRLQDLSHPIKFLRQISGEPPLQFGTQGFRPDIIDDRNPARHYTAFVFVGYWLPLLLGWLVLLGWEVLGFVRYGFHWSSNDVRCGMIGLHHGRAVRKFGAGVMPGLIESELKKN